MWVKRLTFLPVRWLVASMRSSYSGWAGELVGHGDAVDAGADHGVVDVVVDLLAEQVDLQVQVGEALDELLGRPESHACHSFLAPGAGAALALRARARVAGALAR